MSIVQNPDADSNVIANTSIESKAFRRMALTAAQLGVWFGHVSDESRHAYNTGQLTEIIGSVDPAIFHAAAKHVEANTEALRIRVYEDDGVIRQDICPSTQAPVLFDDFSGYQHPTVAAIDLFHQDLAKPFDLSSGKLFRWRLIRVSHDHWYFGQIYHHIAVDGYARRLIASRLALAYSVLAKGHALPVWNQTLTDVIQSDEIYSGSLQRKNDREFWLSHLEHCRESVAWSGRHAVTSKLFHRCTSHLSEKLTEAIRSVDRQNGHGASIYLLAATAMLQTVFSQNDDVVLGLPVFGKLGKTLRETPSMSSNIIHVRFHIRKDQSLKELFDGIAEETRAVLRRQLYRVEHLNRDLGISTGRDLFAISVNLMPFDYNLMFGDANSTTLNLSNGPVGGLSLSAYDYDTSQNLQLDLNGNQELYSHDDLQRYLDQFEYILYQLVASSPEIAVGTLDLIAPREREQIESWQIGPEVTVPEQCLHHIFEIQSRRHPDAIVLIFGSQNVTYRELDEGANRLAHHLIDLGVKRDSIVAVCLERSVALIVTLLAILKAGGAYLPLDAQWPSARIRLMLDELDPSCVVVTDLPHAQEIMGTRRFVAPDGAHRKHYPSHAPDTTAHDTSQLAYVNFTSGSSGKPKGVLTPHRAVLRLIDPDAPWRMEPGDRILQLAPVTFDAATLEIWLPLLSGATLVIAPTHVPSLAEIATHLRQQKISVLWLTAGLFHAMAEAEPEALAGVKTLISGGDVLNPERVRHILSLMPRGHQLINGYGPTEGTTFSCCHVMPAGKSPPEGAIPIGRPIAGTFVAVLDPAGRLCPVGVPGELYIGGTGLARGYLNSPDLTDDKFVSGQSNLDNERRLYRSGDLTSWNSEGVLAFHGRIDNQVKLRGFRIEPAEIEAAFLQHPTVGQVAVLRHQIGNDPYLTAYIVPRKSARSPDEAELRHALAHQLPDYMIPRKFVVVESLPLTENGKLDAKKIAALNDPEIHDDEAPQSATEDLVCQLFSSLTKAPKVSVTDNFFRIGGHSLLAMRLAALIKQETGIAIGLRAIFENPSPRALAHVLDSDPDKSPRPVIGAGIPLTGPDNLNAKNIFADKKLESFTFESPKTATETMLCRLFEQLTKVSKVSVTDNFFTIGGHSLLTMQLVALLKKETGTAIGLRAIFENPSPRALAHVLDSERKKLKTSDDRKSGIDPIATASRPIANSEGSYPASFAQEQLWFLHQFHPDLSSYHIPILYRLSGDLDLPALRQALTKLIERHTPLRSSFHLDEETLFQSIHPVRMPQIDFDDVVGPNIDKFIEEWILTEQATPFDLAKGLLFRVRLLKLSPADHLMMINHHHIASDGGSLPILRRDLAEFYNAEILKVPAQLPTLTVQYHHHAHAQRLKLDQIRLNELLGYWGPQLSGVQPLSFTSDHPLSAQSLFDGASLDFSIPRPLLERLENLCSANTATLQMGLLSIIAVLLSHLSRQRDIVIGVPISTRDRADLDELIGLFVNILPIRCVISDGMSFTELLRNIRNESVNSYEHRDLPFQKIVENLSGIRELRRHPLVQVVVQVLELPNVASPTMIGLEIERIPLRSTAARFDLEFLFERKPDGALSALCTYSTNLFTSSHIEKIIDQLCVLLNSALNSPDAAIGSLDPLPSEEHQPIKSRQPNFGIEPAEIEAALLQQPAVGQVAVHLENAQAENPELRIWWSPRQGRAQFSDAGKGTHNAIAAEFRHILSQLLPAQAIPAKFIKVPIIPMTGSGEVDWKALTSIANSDAASDHKGNITQLEGELYGIWSDLLGHREFTHLDNFFLVGGHSLAATRLVAKLEKTYRLIIPVSAIFRYPTINSQAAWLQHHLSVQANAEFEPSSTNGENIVALQPTGDRPPLFAIHGWGGTLFHFLDLAFALAPDRPVYGLQATEPERKHMRTTTVSAMAETYADQILKLNPNGPIHLLGYSAGGWYAHAVAAALIERGAKIGMLGLLDSHAAGTGIPKWLGLTLTALKILPRVKTHLHNLIQPENEQRRMTYFRGRLNALNYYLDRFIPTRSGKLDWALNLMNKLAPNDIPEMIATDNNDLKDPFVVLLRNHIPPRIPAEAYIFAPSSHMHYLVPLWRYYARRGVKSYPLFADHDDFVHSDKTLQLAETLEGVLSEVEGASH